MVFVNDFDESLPGPFEWDVKRLAASLAVAGRDYLGASDRFDHAIADFAETYADQSERDYAALKDAVKDGRADAASEI